MFYAEIITRAALYTAVLVALAFVAGYGVALIAGGVVGLRRRVRRARRNSIRRA